MLKSTYCTSRLVWSIRALIVSVAAMLLCPFALLAQNARPPDKAGPLTVSVSIANGHLLINAYLINQKEGFAQPISLEVSLEQPGTLMADGGLIHYNTSPDYEKVKKDESDFVDLILNPDVEVSIPRREVTEPTKEQMKFFSDFTKRYAKYMDDRPIKGYLGRGFFSKYRTVFDIGAGTIKLYPLSNEELTADVVLPFEIRKDRMWVTLTYDEKRAGTMMLGSENYDVLIDANLAHGLGKPGGDIGSVFLGPENLTNSIDIASYLAFRPQDFNKPEIGYSLLKKPLAPYVPRPQNFNKEEYDSKLGATLVSGVKLFENLRVEFDWTHSKVGFTRTDNPEFPEVDLDFFKAEASGRADELQAHLQRHPQSRLAPEAAFKLMKWRWAEKAATDDQLMTAMQWIVDLTPADRKMEDVEEYVMKFARTPGRGELTVRAGKLAAKYSREAFINQGVYRLHNYIGEGYLALGNYQEAWKHFLTAAFMPLGNAMGPQDEEFEDMPVNTWHNSKVQFNLGLVYEKQGKMLRAYSRYRKAATKTALEGYVKNLVTMNFTEEQIANMAPFDRRYNELAQQVLDALERLDGQVSEEDKKTL